MTDKLRRSMSTTDSTETIQEPSFIYGSEIELIKKIIRLALCDLLSNSQKLRADAQRYLLSSQFRTDCEALQVNCNDVRIAAAEIIPLKKSQQRAIIKQLLRQLGV